MAWGAWTGRRWPVVVGATIALPVYYITSSAMLVGVLPYARQALGRLVEGRFPTTGPARDGAIVPSPSSPGDPSMSVDSAP